MSARYDCASREDLCRWLDMRGDTIASLQRSIAAQESIREELLDTLDTCTYDSRESARIIATQRRRIDSLREQLADSEQRSEELARQLAPLLALDALHSAQLERVASESSERERVPLLVNSDGSARR